MGENLKQKTIAGMLWNSIQKFGCAILSFISNLILARILMPDDFGCIGMLTIFIAISETFVDGGFGAALIQQKNPKSVDYSTIFVWNIVVSIVFYGVTYFTAPYISEFYHIPSLCLLLRVLGFVIILNGLGIIQLTILTKELQFKRLSIIYLIGTLIGVLISVVCAYYGWGVWSLVAKTISTSLIVLILLWSWNCWKLSLSFSYSSFKKLFKFGSLMFLSKIFTTLFDNLQGLIIGRVYSATALGYYTQARKLDEIPSSSISQIVTQVSFPVFSKISHDLEKLKTAVKKNIICVNFTIFPLQILLILLSKDLIIFLFSDRWIESVIFFKILCVYALFVGLNAINTNVYKAIGKSNVYLIIQLLKQLIGIVLIIGGMHWGIVGVAASISVSGLIWWLLSSMVNKRLIGYGFTEQLIDILPSFILSIISAIPVYIFIIHSHLEPIFTLIIATILYLALYILISKALNKVPYSEYAAIMANVVRNFK